MALWLYAGLTERLPSAARTLVAGREPKVSALTVLELTCLHEIGRARDSAPAMLAALRQSMGLEVADASLVALAEAAAGLSWTRDPFDRLISAHAIVADAPLVTADQTILANLPQATWS